MTFDELRAANPELGYALYALEPAGLVTLEVITPAGAIYAFTGPTAADAIDALVGSASAVEETIDIFD